MSEGQLKQKSWEGTKVYWLLEMGSHEEELKNSEGAWVPVEVLDEAKAEFPYLADCQLRIKEQYPTLTPEESYLRAFQLFKDEACAWRDKWFGAP